jgi:hypothetical protein
MPNAKNVDSPIVMIGAGRSGTSWLMDMMFRHPDVDVVVDNTLLGAIYRDAYNSWWTPAFHRVHCAKSAETQQQRVAEAIRAAFCVMFPGERPAWVTKAIWDGTKPSFGAVPNGFRIAAFPRARYLHFCRSPLTCIPSIHEYFAEQGQLDTIAQCEEAYCSAHRDAFRIRDAGVPYLKVTQEGIREKPSAAWREICQFAGIRAIEIDEAALSGEVNASESMRGKVHGGREPLQWSELGAGTHAMARELGYEIPDGAAPRPETEAQGETGPREPDAQATIERLVSEKKFLENELRRANALSSHKLPSGRKGWLGRIFGAR